jgi:4-diphosphocytidyl-2-C-methyl-D-erythritol kinase
MRDAFLAPAKINLCLHVLGKRPDGYHELLMLMQRVTLFDRVVIELTPASKLAVSCAGVPLAPGEENIAARAARLLLGRAGVARRVALTIDKQIPVAAGLGGGSSDAATVLLGLNRMLDLGASRETLRDLGRELGADVPFFVLERQAWAAGIGDILDPVPELPRVSYLLVNPGVAVSTAWVYGNLGLTPPGDVAKLREFPKTPEGLVRLLHNDLERVTVGRYPELAGIKAQLLSLGAAGALMSGSGPTLFGVFDDPVAARRARQVLQAVPGWRVFLVEPLGDGPAKGG